MIVAGLRARLLHDSFQNLVEEALALLGWFDTDRAHKPVRFFHEPVDWDQAIVFNSMVVVARSRITDYIEVGSNLTQDSVTVGVDIYGESESFTLDIANDVKDILRGRLTPAASRGTFEILDLQLATPVPIGHAVITNVRATRVPPQIGQVYTRHWFGVDATVLDTYYDAGETP